MGKNTAATGSTFGAVEKSWNQGSHEGCPYGITFSSCERDGTVEKL